MKDAVFFMLLIALAFATFAAAGLGTLIWLDVWDKLRPRFKTGTQKPRAPWPPID